MSRQSLVKRLALAVFALFFLAYYSLLFISAKPAVIQQDLVRTFEFASKGKFEYSRFRLFHFPVLQTEFSDVQLKASEPTNLTFKAKRMRLNFSFWAFLFAKAEITKISIDGGELHLQTPATRFIDNLDVQNLRLRIWWNQGQAQARLEGEGDLEGIARSIAGKGTIGKVDFKTGNWKQAFLDGNIYLKNFPAAKFHYQAFKDRNISLKDGSLGAHLYFHKESQGKTVRFQGRGDMKGFIYEVQDDASRLVSPQMELHAETEVEWNPEAQIVDVKTTNVVSPLGKLQAGGRILLGSNELKDMRVRLSEVMLESIPQYYLPFKEAVPFNFGFSGRSDMEMSMQGTLDKLIINANWDLSPSLLTYGSYFAKPKDMPLNMAFDCVLDEGHKLSGDFSLKLQQAGLRGAIANLNLRTGEGQLNLLTNKFKLQNTAALFPPFQGYALGGGVKILANFDGNLLQRPREVKSMVNLTLENVSISRGENSLRNIFMALDYSPISVEIKEAQIATDEQQPLFFTLTVYDPTVNPKAKATFTSQKVDAVKLLATIESLGQEWMPKNLFKRLQRARKTAAYFLPPGQTMEQSAAEIEVKDRQFTIHKLQMNAYDGSVKLKGQWDFTNPDESVYQFQPEIDRLNLAKWFTKDNQKRLNGNLFFKGDFHGTDWDEENWKNLLKGNGAVSVTNGEFLTFSVLEEIADIQGFGLLLPSASDTTSFDDLQAEFLVSDGKAVTEKVTILSRDFKGFAEGEVTLNGLMNYRLNIFLSYGLARDILEPILENSSGQQDNSFGPISLLVSGTLEQPEINTDPSKLAELKDNLAKKKVQKVLRNFLPEEALFKRLKSS